MKIGQKGIDLIKYYEGFSPITYLCPAGYPTIGYGHVVREGEVFDEPITEEFACELLANDLESYAKAVERLIKVPLSRGQFDALVSFCYNLGWGALQCSTLRSNLNRAEYMDAADQFPKWVYARVGGVLLKLAGLIKRRNSERSLFLIDLDTYEESDEVVE